MAWTGLLAGFLSHLRGHRRAAAHTVTAYQRELIVLAQQIGATTVPADVAPHQLRQLLAHGHAGGLSGRSLGRRLSAWRGFYHWLQQQGQVVANPCLGLRPPRSGRRLPRALSPDEARQLLDGGAEGPLACRDMAMFELFYSSGLRLSELAGLDRPDGETAVSEGELTVTGKRDKQRTVPVGSKAREALATWLARRQEVVGKAGEAPEEMALFLSQRGGRLSSRAIAERLRQRALAAGLERHVHPHMLRHSCASHVLQSSGDLRAVQELLGHASIASTQVYTHLDFQHLAQVYDAAHPRARREKSKTD